MISTLLKNWWTLLVKGIILIVLSILVFSKPAEAILGLAIFIGIGFLLSGILHTISALAFRKEIKRWGWYLAEGLVDLFFGILFLAKPQLTATLIVFMVGFWFMFYAITVLILSFYLKEEGNKKWWVELILGILGVLFSFLIIFNPFAGALTIVWLLGFSFLMAGIFNIALAFLLKEDKEELKELSENIDN